MAWSPGILCTLCFTGFVFLLLGESSITSVQAHVLKRSVPLFDEFKQLTFSGLSTDDSSKWEFAHVKFVTQLRHRRDLTERKFHIIQIHRPASNSTMEIHLVKKSISYKSFKMVIYENGVRSEVDDPEDASDCQYSGVFSNDPEGMAALSSCHHHGGFSGLIVTSEGHFVIEPHAESGSEAHFEGTMTFTHILVKMNASASAYGNPEEGSKRHSDVLYMPEDEFQKHAQAERERYAKYFNETESHNETETEESDEEQEDETDSNSVMSTSPPQTIRAVLVKSLAAKTKKAKKAATTKKPKTAKQSGASKNGHPTVEMAVYCDPPLFEHMKKRYPKDTEKKMKEYVMTIVHAMDMLYQQSSLGNDLGFKLVHLEIQITWPAEIDHGKGQLLKYLNSFCDYAGDQNEATSMWDHALALTGLDIKDGTESGVLGVAWAGTMCFKYRSCSLSEGHDFGLVFIITHEIGHSVAMDHDGDRSGTSGACNANKNIMSPTTGPGKVTWSSCSAQNLRDFLQYGTNRPQRGGSMKPLCLTMPSIRADSVSYTSSVLPGQKYNMAEQCLQYGSNAKPSSTRNQNMCSMAYCNVNGYDRQAHPALEGTTCASGKVCKLGKCE